MAGYSFYSNYDNKDSYVDRRTVETLSREVTKIITEQIKQAASMEDRKSRKEKMK